MYALKWNTFGVEELDSSTAHLKLDVDTAKTNRLGRKEAIQTWGSFSTSKRSSNMGDALATAADCRTRTMNIHSNAFSNVSYVSVCAQCLKQEWFPLTPL